MTASALINRLRPGRDPNDTSWQIVRSRTDWQAGKTWGLGYDSGRGSLELAPLARPELAATWLANGPVIGTDGVAWRIDTNRNLLLRKDACSPDFMPVAGIGGKGFATGRLNVPVSLAIDSRGWIWIADANNGRVQVWAPDEATVIAVLTEGLARPVHVTFDGAGTAFVVDAATREVHVFSARFSPLRRLALATIDAWTGASWVWPPKPEPRAATILPDGTLAVFDPTRPGLWHMTSRGVALPSLSWFADADVPPGWQPTPARFAAEGEVVVGPFDGGTNNFAWHRVLVEADLPPGCAVTVQTYANNAKNPGAYLFAPRQPLAMPKAAADRPGEVYDRLVLPETDMWPLSQLGLMIRARPELHYFDGDGPVATDRATVPFAVARQLHPGDRVRLTTVAGGSDEFQITAIDPQPVTVAASGAAGAFLAAGALRLVARDGQPLPFGPLDLAFLGEPGNVSIAGLVRDGTPETAALPAVLAAFLQTGDIVSLGAGDARLEILAIAEDEAVLHFDRAAPGDFATSTLTLLDTAGRLVVAEAPLPTGQFAPGTAISLIDDVRSERHNITWLDGASATVWLAAGGLGQVITAESWTDLQFDPARATDCGRYAWLRLRLSGAGLAAPDGVGPARIASATPRLHSLRLTGPRPRLLALLPALFSRRIADEDPPGANFLERFLALFEGQFTHIEEAYESVSRLLNPRAADSEWLSFVAAWLDLSFDPSWPIARRRQLVIEGAKLQAGRGTPWAMVRWLEIYTGASVAITEGFRMRPPAPIELGSRGALGVAPLGRARSDTPDRFAHRFTVAVTLPGAADRATAKAAVRKIIEAMKPAHTAYVLDAGSGQTTPRIGINTVIDAIFIPGAAREAPCLCDSDKAGGARPETGQVPGGFRLGGRLGRGPVSELGANGG